MTEMQGTKRARVATDLRARIEAGEFDAKGQLPPERVLASDEEYGVARETLRRVLEQLQSEGLVFRCARGRGGSWKLGQPTSAAGNARTDGRFEDLPGAMEYLQLRVEMLRRHEREQNDMARRHMAESVQLTDEFRVSLHSRLTVEP